VSGGVELVMRREVDDEVERRRKEEKGELMGKG
jgi:hypothetical protein